MTEKDSANEIVGISESIIKLRDYLPKVGRSFASVLITGETGTGKERVAELIHRFSGRQGPLVCLNCAAIPDSLLESELFGFERGAFSGAALASLGKVRLANHGTLLLDEIGDMSLASQAKVLRMIENRNVFPLGSSRSFPVDVRLIAATNQDLERLLISQHFRKDLYYRLNVARIALLPLRERKEDIGILFDYFIAELNHRYRYSVESPTTEVINTLFAHDWPGNVRELRNVVETVFIEKTCGPIGLSDLPDIIRNACINRDRGSRRDRLISELYSAKWNKSLVAERMHISRTTVYRRLAKHAIPLSLDSYAIEDRRTTAGQGSETLVFRPERYP